MALFAAGGPDFVVVLVDQNQLLDGRSVRQGGCGCLMLRQ
jgi:hypothetical protein